MTPPPRPASARPPLPGRVTLLLLAILLAVNATAVWGLFSARRSARRLAFEDLARQTEAHALAVEAALATLRGDLIYLAQAPPVGRAPEFLSREDPVARRWGRLEVEGALLLFMQAHPAVRGLTVWGRERSALAVAGRRQGAPVLLPPRSPAVPEEAGLISTRWPLDPGPGVAAARDPGTGQGQIEAWLDPAAVLATAVPGFEERLTLELARGQGDGEDARARGDARAREDGGARGDGGVREDGEWLEARARVVEPSFAPPLAFDLVRRERESQVVGSVETLTGLFGTAVAVNLAVVTLTFALAMVAFRQVRRAAQLAAEGEQQERLRHLERKVLASERLASVGRLAAGMAHEINNPLEGMSSYLTLLEEDLAAGRTDEAPELAARVREGLDRIAGITRQVLTYASPERAPRERVDLGALVRTNVDFLGRNPAFRGVELHFAEPSEAVMVEGNATTLHQLVLNLLLNALQMQGAEDARDAEGAEGAGQVEVTVAGDGRGALLTVADRGPGLSAEALRHAFEPFFSTRGGTGLGLAVCRGIVREHGGEIRAENRPGGGALFAVELPRSGMAGATLQ